MSVTTQIGRTALSARSVGHQNRDFIGLSRDREFAYVIYRRATRSKVRSIRTDKVVLDVYTITNDIRGRSPLAVDGRALIRVPTGARLRENKVERISSV